MKKRLVILVCFLGLTLISAGVASAITLQFAATTSINDAKVDISGTALSFTVQNNDNFSISGSNSLLHDSIGDYGILVNPVGGSFTIGTIHGIAPADQYAAVTGLGHLTIHDGSGHDFTSDLNVLRISQDGSGVNLNNQDVINLSNTQYSGFQTDLIALASPVGGIATVSWTYIPVKSLTDLTSGGHNTSSFSGTLNSVTAPVPLPPTALLFGSGLLGLGLLRRRWSLKK